MPITPSQSPAASTGRPQASSSRLARYFGATPPPTSVGVAVCAALLIAESALTVVLHVVAPGEHLAATFLLGVLIVSAIWRLGLAVAMSIVSAVIFDWVRNWPSPPLVSTESNYLLIHLAFLAVAFTANALASLARARTEEVERQREEATEVAEQQAALRRIATLVAQGVAPAKLYSAVVEEATACLHASGAILIELLAGNEGVLLAARGNIGAQPLSVGTHFALPDIDDPTTALGLPACLVAQIVVNGRQWGILAVHITPSGAEVSEPIARVKDFADLVATAIANAAARQELAASRARIVTAADTARRRLERDLHDGAQQRLVSLRLKLGMVRASLPPELDELHGELNSLDSDLTGVTHDLQEFSRGIHPAILSSGLGPALRTLARRSAIPVNVDTELDDRLPEPVEMAAYYVVAEALANAAKHSRASQVDVRVRLVDNQVHLTIGDDGVGGAQPRKGSGLIGLADRVEALGGRLDVDSPVGRGTSMTAKIPLDQSS